MAHSCNGFSGGVDTDAFKSDKFESGFDPVWSDVLEKHEMIGYHAMVGGGDQVGARKEKEIAWMASGCRAHDDLIEIGADLLRLHNSRTRTSTLD